MLNYNTLIIILTVLALCVAIFIPDAMSHTTTTTTLCLCWPLGTTVTYGDGCITIFTCALVECRTTTNCHSH